MKQIKYFFFTVLFSTLAVGLHAQKTTSVNNAAFGDKISSLLTFSIPLITVHDLRQNKNMQLLDARELVEYEVSHIPNAKYIGYKSLNEAALKEVNKNEPVVIYCSIGYRSEKIGEKLVKLGYKKVYNLYGSIFEWANTGLPLVDVNNKPTKNIHVYDKSWGKWMENPNYKKVY